jgi:Methylmalonic aciduria and homocystinuria type D protein
MLQQACLIHLVTATGQAIQLSIHPPSPFITQNLERVIPDWNLAVVWVIVFLQQSRYELVETTLHVEREKERLREKFIRFGFEVAFKLRDRGFLTDLIDPRTGYPLLSQPGQIPHDDTAVVKALLGYPIVLNRCRVLEHCSWGTAVYPSIMMSSASPSTIQPVLKRVANQHGWKQQTNNYLLSMTGA